MCGLKEIIDTCIIWLKENHWIIEVIILPIAGLIGFIIKSRREKKLHYAANVVWELTLEKMHNDNAMYTLNVHNQGNFCAKDLTIILKLPIDNNGNKKHFWCKYDKVEYNIGHLLSTKDKQIPVKIDYFPNVPIYAIVKWKDDFNKIFKHREKIKLREKGKEFDSKTMTIDV
ncbi:MAG: hypothetical protein J6U13_07340 [Salinivirgaceae bacterium]|nr:hypothetical protein [Salinivirgaceae bacterium]